MGKHPIGGMRSKIVSNRMADMRYRKREFLRAKDHTEMLSRKQSNGAEYVSEEKER